uniref:LEM domain-containing protein n=1 Tax=Trichobilharzia regenti TaxID=157069 RepID=A0AA85K5C6_TRIRE|nr:unnamed protein product [Trichobilharzia regenti]
MAASLGDDELRRELKALGVDAGPITATTRSVYVKKLEKLQKERKQPLTAPAPKEFAQAPKQNAKIRKPTNVATQKDVVSTPVLPTLESSNVHNIRSPFIISRKRNIIEENREHATEGDRHLGNKLFSSTKVQSTRHEMVDLSEPYTDIFPSSSQLESSKVTGTFHNDTDEISSTASRRPTSVRNFSRSFTKSTTNYAPTKKTYVYIREDSADEDDTDEESTKPSPVSSTLSRVAGWLNRSAHEFAKPKSPGNESHYVKSTPRPRHSVHNDRLQISDTDNSDIENSTRSPFFKQLYSSPFRNMKSRDTGITTSPGLLFTPPSRSFERSKHHGTSVLSEDADMDDPSSSEKQYNQKKNVPSSLLFGKYFSSNVSYIPNLILISSISLFVILVASYLFLRDHHGEVGKMADVQKLLCRSSDGEYAKGLHRCLHDEDLTATLSVLGTLYDILSRYAGEFHCKIGSLNSPRLSVSTAERLVEHNLQMKGWPLFRKTDFHRVWENTLYVLLHVGKKHFHLVAIDATNSALGPFSHVGQIVELESLQPYFPGVCRLRQWFQWFTGVCTTVLCIALVCLVISFLAYGVYLLRSRRLRALERQACRVRELVAEVVYLLQNQLRENEANPDQPPYIPVYVIRERLRQKHHDVEKLWSEIVRYVYEVETCIAVQEWRGIGETWQWQSGTGWQGSAVMDKSQKPSFIVPPTECLKIRNMFSTEGIDERGRRRIKRELLKKLISCGPILHIGLDSVRTNGLVYVKCADADTAGRVFHSIHANYFDGRLLTVKFLRDAKYCLRFPEAHNVKQPLRLGDFE